MVAGETTKRGQRYPYYVCQTAQKRGTRACPGKLVVAQRIEEAVVRVVCDLASRPEREALRQYFPVDRAGWEELERREQHEIVAEIVERIIYDRRLGQGRMRLREEIGGAPNLEIVIRANKEPLVRQSPPAPTRSADTGAGSADYQTARAGGAIGRAAAGLHGEGLCGSGAVGRSFAGPDHAGDESAESRAGIAGA